MDPNLLKYLEPFGSAGVAGAFCIWLMFFNRKDLDKLAVAVVGLAKSYDRNSKVIALAVAGLEGVVPAGIRRQLKEAADEIERESKS